MIDFTTPTSPVRGEGSIIEDDSSSAVLNQEVVCGGSSSEIIVDDSEDYFQFEQEREAVGHHQQSQQQQHYPIQQQRSRPRPRESSHQHLEETPSLSLSRFQRNDHDRPHRRVSSSNSHSNDANDGSHSSSSSSSSSRYTMLAFLLFVAIAIAHAVATGFENMHQSRNNRMGGNHEEQKIFTQQQQQGLGNSFVQEINSEDTASSFSSSGSSGINMNMVDNRAAYDNRKVNEKNNGNGDSATENEAAAATILTRASQLSSLISHLDASDVVECYVVTRMAHLTNVASSNINSNNNGGGGGTNNGNRRMQGEVHRMLDESITASASTDTTESTSKSEESSPNTSTTSTTTTSSSSMPSGPVSIRKSALAFRYRPRVASASRIAPYLSAETKKTADPSTDYDLTEADRIERSKYFELTLEYGPQRTGAARTSESVPMVRADATVDDYSGNVVMNKYVSWENEGRIYHSARISEEWTEAYYMAPITGVVLEKIIQRAAEYAYKRPRYQPFEVVSLPSKKLILRSSGSDDFVWDMFRDLADLYVDINPLLIPTRGRVQFYVADDDDDGSRRSEGDGAGDGSDSRAKGKQQQQRLNPNVMQVKGPVEGSRAAVFYENFFNCANAIKTGDYSLYMPPPTVAPTLAPTIPMRPSAAPTISMRPTASPTSVGGDEDDNESAAGEEDGSYENAVTNLDDEGNDAASEVLDAKEDGDVMNATSLEEGGEIETPDDNLSLLKPIDENSIDYDANFTAKTVDEDDQSDEDRMDSNQLEGEQPFDDRADDNQLEDGQPEEDQLDDNELEDEQSEDDQQDDNHLEDEQPEENESEDNQLEEQSSEQSNDTDFLHHRHLKLQDNFPGNRRRQLGNITDESDSPLDTTESYDVENEDDGDIPGLDIDDYSLDYTDDNSDGEEDSGDDPAEAAEKAAIEAVKAAENAAAVVATNNDETTNTTATSEEVVAATNEAAKAANKAKDASVAARSKISAEALLSGDGELMTSVLSNCFSDEKYGIRRQEEVIVHESDIADSSIVEGNNNAEGERGHDSVVKTRDLTYAYIYLDGHLFIRLNLTPPYMGTVSTLEIVPPPHVPPEGKGDMVDWAIFMIILMGILFGFLVMVHQVGVVIDKRLRFRHIFHPTMDESDWAWEDGSLEEEEQSPLRTVGGGFSHSELRMTVESIPTSMGGGASVSSVSPREFASLVTSPEDSNGGIDIEMAQRGHHKSLSMDGKLASTPTNNLSPMEAASFGDTGGASTSSAALPTSLRMKRDSPDLVERPSSRSFSKVAMPRLSPITEQGNDSKRKLQYKEGNGRTPTLPIDAS